MLPQKSHFLRLKFEFMSAPKVCMTSWHLQKDKPNNLSNWKICETNLHGREQWKCSFVLSLLQANMKCHISATLLISTAKTHWFSEHNFYLFAKILSMFALTFWAFFVFSEDLFPSFLELLTDLHCWPWLKRHDFLTTPSNWQDLQIAHPLFSQLLMKWSCRSFFFVVLLFIVVVVVWAGGQDRVSVAAVVLVFLELDL